VETKSNKKAGWKVQIEIKSDTRKSDVNRIQTKSDKRVRCDESRTPDKRKNESENESQMGGKVR
jgi:hypothetical protein